MIPRWGVLHHTMTMLDNSYHGTVFVRTGATGHLFNRHYLDTMFPLPLEPSNTQTNATGAAFLDRIVDVDEKTAIRRESAAVRKMAVAGPGSSTTSIGDGEEDDDLLLPLLLHHHQQHHHHPPPPPPPEGTFPPGILPAGGRKLLSGLGREARGKTVRQLSRLWMYLDGGTPVDGKGGEREVNGGN